MSRKHNQNRRRLQKTAEKKKKSEPRTAQKRRTRPHHTKTQNDKTQPHKPRNGKLRATIDKNLKGFGFLVFDDKSLEDIYLPLEQ